MPSSFCIIREVRCLLISMEYFVLHLILPSFSVTPLLLHVPLGNSKKTTLGQITASLLVLISVWCLRNQRPICVFIGL